MLIDKIGEAISFRSMDGACGEVFVNPKGNIVFKINITLNGTPHLITLLDELINFIPLFYFQLPKKEKEEWECITFLDTELVSTIHSYKIDSFLSKGRLWLNIDNISYIFDLSKLMFSKQLLGESIYQSLLTQAEYLED